MERAVARGQMVPAEFHRRKAEMMESLALGVDDGRTKTSGVIRALYGYYQRDGRDVARVWLCAETDHFHSSGGDKGWGCGYRNFQMLVSSLLKMDQYKDCFKDKTVPCIPKVQALIEDAWKEGADPQGASHFNRKLQGTRAWIGATEIYSMLISLRVKSRILDFHCPTGPSDTHPRLFQWVRDYYSTAMGRGERLPPRVVHTASPPIYLQHQGHSRTIIGIEERKNGNLCLLIFDPGCPSQELQKLLQPDLSGARLKHLRKLPSALKHKQYQIVAVEGTLSQEEKHVQALIEDAWKEGADPQGASHFNRKLQGTRAWIGATEIYSMLISLRVKSRILDFHCPTGPSDTHPRLFQWVRDYYSTAMGRGERLPPRVVHTASPPIYLQHQGHSRTIIGIEERKNGNLCLLIFDPGCPSQELQKLLQPDLSGARLKHLRKLPSALKHKQYQIVAVEGTLSQEEKHDLKAAVLKICSFLGKQLDEQQIDSVVKHCTFKQMKTNPNANYESVPESLLNHKNGAFMRKGTVGDWKNHLTVAQNEMFDQVFQERMRDLPLKFVWDISELKTCS
ncbi:UNVERIFIED_CONTAM: hypothetical protein FKN15_043029 [Acipenser sinensis]